MRSTHNNQASTLHVVYDHQTNQTALSPKPQKLTLVRAREQLQHLTVQNALLKERVDIYRDALEKSYRTIDQQQAFINSKLLQSRF